MTGIDRRTVLAGLGAASLSGLAPRRLRARERPYRIFMITWRGWEDASQGFKDYLDRRGVPIELIVRDAQRDRERVAEFAAEAKALEPDLVYTWGTTTALTTFGRYDTVDPGAHVTDIPSVFTIVSDPVGSGLVRSYGEPRENLTGTLYIAPVETQLRTIEAYGPFERLGTVYNALESNARLTVEAIERIAGESAFDYRAVPISLTDDGRPDVAALPDAVRALKDDGADWLYIPPDSFLNVNRLPLTESATAIGLPSFASAENFVRDAMALLGLVSRYYNVGQFTGYVAEQILVHGASPQSIPVESLDRFSLLINMAAAHALDFYPPMSMLTIAEFTRT